MDKNIDYNRISLVQNKLDEIVSTKQAAGCSCLIIKDRKELGYFEAGYRDIENKLLITRDTIFRMFSMSKITTAIATMQLMENGMIDLLDPVSKYIPGFANQKCYDNGKITAVNREVLIKDLLDMTSGLCYPGELNETERETGALFDDISSKIGTAHEMSTVEIANAIGKVPLAFQPGDKWNYGFSADVLGAVVEVVSGMPYSEYLYENIFKPLEMYDTGFYVPKDKQDRLAKTYTKTETGLSEYTGEFLLIQSRMREKPKFESGGAGLTSTIDDYSKICQMLLNNGEYKGRKILHPETVKFMTAGSLTDKQREYLNWESLFGHTYGNLLRVVIKPGSASGACSLGEYGWDGWTGVYMSNIPEYNMTILYMMQRSDTGTIDVTRKVRNIIFSAIK